MALNNNNHSLTIRQHSMTRIAKIKFLLKYLEKYESVFIYGTI
jgi:hypothetical protein